MLTSVGRDARTLPYRQHRQTPAAASRSLQDLSPKPKQEDAPRPHQSCNVPQQQPLCGVRLWASSQHHHLMPDGLTGVAATTAATPPRWTPSRPSNARTEEAASANKWWCLAAQRRGDQVTSRC